MLKIIPSPLAEQLGEYVVAHGLSSPVSTADLILACLRINTEQSLSKAQELMGKTITKCPPHIPPWPPKKVVTERPKTVVRIAPENPCLPSTGAHSRFKQIRVGHTVDQLLARGISRRDLRVWTKKNHLEFSK